MTRHRKMKDQSENDAYENEDENANERTFDRG